MRRSLTIDEASYGEDHSKVARDLNNLAQLLRATNRLVEAEPLSRRMVEIFIRFTFQTGHQHPHLNVALQNYGGLLNDLGQSQGEPQDRIDALVQSVRECVDRERG